MIGLWRIRAAWWRFRSRLFSHAHLVTLDLRETPVARLVLPDGRVMRVPASTTFLEIPVATEARVFVGFDGIIEPPELAFKRLRYRLEWSSGRGYEYVFDEATA